MEKDIANTIYENQLKPLVDSYMNQKDLAKIEEAYYFADSFMKDKKESRVTPTLYTPWK